MSQTVNTFGALRAEMKERLKPVLEYVIEKIADYNKNAISFSVYSKGHPDVYERTFEFLDAWSTEEKFESDALYSTHFYDSSKIRTRDRGQHTSVIDGTDIADALADIIFEGKAGRIFGSGFWTKRRNAWGMLDKYVSKRRLKQWVEEGMRQAGLAYKFTGKYPEQSHYEV